MATMGGCSNWPAIVPVTGDGMLGGWIATGGGGGEAGFALAGCASRGGGAVVCAQLDRKAAVSRYTRDKHPSLLLGVIGLGFMNVPSERIFEITFSTQSILERP
jgi:hypothetical protein